MKDQIDEKDKICKLCGAPNWYFLEYCHECHKMIMEDFDWRQLLFPLNDNYYSRCVTTNRETE